MQSDNLQGIKIPNVSMIRERLEKTGLALEYFPAFLQNQHDYHGHDFIEILFVMKGSFRHVTADSSYDEVAGGITVINNRQYHSLRTPDGPVELMNIYLKPSLYPLPDIPEPLSSRLYELMPLHPQLGNRLNRISHLSVPDIKKLETLLMLMYKEQNETAPGQEAAMQSLLRLLLIELCRAADVRKEASRDAYARRIEKVCRYLEKNYSRPIALDEMCRISGLNPANLCRRFKTHTGMSTGNYLKQRRLAAAVQKLRTGNDKILTISQECGFTDISRFNRFFREAFSCSPSAYRRRIKDRSAGWDNKNPDSSESGLY